MEHLNRRHLCDNGNVLSEKHQAALFALCGLFTESAQGKRPGRWAFSLPTGMGKTSAIVAWCAALQLVCFGGSTILSGAGLAT